MKKTGKFIVIEGADGVGSTTQCRMLVDFLNNSGTNALFTAEPSSGAIGQLARSMLKGSEKPCSETLALLFAADRIEHFKKEIRPAIEEGITVVSDRYVLSSLVYQSLDLPIEWIRDLNKHAPRPDHTILINVPFEIAWSRICSRLASRQAVEEVFDKKELQQQIHRLYQQLISSVGGISIDGSGTPEETLRQVVCSLSLSHYLV